MLITSTLCMKFASALRRGLAFGVMALLLLTTACDSPSPTATSDSSKANVESSFSKDAPADKPGSSEIPGDEVSEPIPGQYIVVLHEEAVSVKSDAAIRSIATSMLGKSADLRYTYTTALQGFTAAGVSEKQAETLSSDSRVKFVE